MGLTITKVEVPEPEPRPTHLPPRNWQDKPMIIVPGQETRVPYFRASSIGGSLEDLTNVNKWKSRLVTLGAYRFPRILEKMSAITDPDDAEQKKLMNKITEELQDLAGMSSKAMRGTDIHAISEEMDIGTEMYIPDHYVKPVENYRKLVEEMKSGLGYRVWATELFGVNDTFKAAGTTDRVGWIRDELCIIDLKTSGSMDFSMGKFAMQLLTYAGMVRYHDLEAQQGAGRYPIHPEESVSQVRAYIMWVPQSGEQAALGEVNLTEAVEGFKLAEDLREWRRKWNRKALKFTPSITV